jgi:DNA modification methylase
MYELLCGDCIEVMKTLPANSVQCCVTSPPYYGLRDYGVDGQIGLEETPYCGIQPGAELELRADLTSDEIDYVLRELRKCGLL